MPFVPASDVLNLAAGELRFLLERGYPRIRSLTLVGNRHNLASRERELLRRAVLAPDRARTRRGKLASSGDMAGADLGIDGHNVLITLESALAGKDLVQGDDGVIRDIAGAGSSFRPTDLTERALGLILRTLTGAGTTRADFFLDKPISRSGELAGAIRRELDRAGLDGTARPLPVPEKELKTYSGLVGGSDGELIDFCDRPLDLAGLIIVERLREAEIIEFTS